MEGVSIKFYSRGQGATEYLVLLAIVLMVAMVAIALLGFFPGLSNDARITQSDAYWKGQAKPFAILDHSQSSQSSNITMIVQNVEAEHKGLNLIKIAGSGMKGNLTPNASYAWFSGGEKKIYVINVSANCSRGSNYEYYVNFSYNNSANTVNNKLEIGSKTLVGKCS